MRRIKKQKCEKENKLVMILMIILSNGLILIFAISAWKSYLKDKKKRKDTNRLENLDDL